MGRLIFSRLVVEEVTRNASASKKNKDGVASLLERVHLILLTIAVSLIALPQANAQFAQQGSKLVGTGAVGSAKQGYSVSLSSDGNTAIVGGYGDNSDAGAVWVWTRSGGVWTQQGSKLVGTGAVGGARQGYSVSLSSDGNTAIVGGTEDNSSTGAVWVFIRSGGIWTQQGSKLVGTGAVDGTGGALQGKSVSLSSDGNTAIVGGYGDNSDAGAVWVWTRSGGVWTQQGSKLVGTGAVGGALQGRSVSLSSDGNTAIVGGASDNSNAGAAWVWTRSGGVWSQQGSKLVGTSAVGGAKQGYSVSLSSDGNTAIVSGFNDNSGVGAVWVWTRSSGVWTQQGSKLVGTGAVGSASQGISVSLSSDGNTAIVGGSADNSFAGAVWVWTRSGGAWTQQGSKLVGTGSSGGGGVGGPYQGESVSLSSDGNTAIVGGTEDNSSTGAVWIYATPNAPLPVELTSFSVTSQRLNAELQWKTATEVNNYGFEVERRRIQATESSSQKEGTLWTESGFVEGAGTSNTPREYTFSEKDLATSKYEYRLKQIDQNGNFHYSQSVQVEVGVAPKVFELSQNYPNPFNPSTEIKFSVATTAHAMVSVYNLLGEQVALLYDANAEAGQYYSVKLDGSRLSSGMYLYRLQSAGFRETKKLMLVK